MLSYTLSHTHTYSHTHNHIHSLSYNTKKMNLSNSKQIIYLPEHWYNYPPTNDFYICVVKCEAGS